MLWMEVIIYLLVKQSALVSSTGLMLSILHEENSWLFASAPSVAWGNMMKFPCVPPGEQTPLGSCWTYIHTYMHIQGVRR